jgi:pimeloyl-ACP methyl ester carboxylesterase
MKRIAKAIAPWLLFAAACNSNVASQAANAESIATADAASTSVSFIGTARRTSATTWMVTNPSSYFESGESAELWVQLFTPSSSSSANPTVVLVPGGDDDSDNFLGARGWARAFTAAGFSVIIFDPQGRGNSTGTEDDNGYEGQDGLAEVIRFAKSLPQVDASRIGIVSNSYGVSLASGALARHADLRVKYFIDWEGPADRTDTAGCVGNDSDGDGDYDSYTEISYAPGQRAPHLARRTTCDDTAFWEEREATRFISSLPVPYRRYQSATDHVQDDYGHTVKLVNGALSGHGPVYVNDTRVLGSSVTESQIAGWAIPESEESMTGSNLAAYAQLMSP